MKNGDHGEVTLYGYYRSSSSHRVQIGLRLKEIPFRYVSISLDKREQETPAFRAVNPGGQIPVLVVGDQVFTHAFAMLELLDELFPGSGVKLLPADPLARARAREITQAVACLMQPFQLPWSIRKRMVEAFQLDKHPLGVEGACRAFTTSQLTAMMGELNRLVARSAGQFSVGDTPSIADCAVIPQLVASAPFGIDLNAYAALSKVYETCSRHPVFKAAHPTAMPDAPAASGHATSPVPAALPVSSHAAAPTVIETAMAYKESDAVTSRYLAEEANQPVPGMDFVREEAFRLFGPVATKMSARDVCFFIRWLAAEMKARTVIEVGVFTGSSSLALLQGMPADGRLIAFDVSAEYTAIAREAWRRQKWDHRVELHVADAAEKLPGLAGDPRVAGKVDLAYIDGPNTEYMKHYELILPLMRPGGVIVFDNVLWKGKVARPDPGDDAQTVHLRALNAFLKSDPRVDACVVDLGDGIALATRRGD